MRFILSPSRVIVALSFGAFAVAGIVVNPHALDARLTFENLNAIGSLLGGGTEFSRECPDNHVLTGIRYRRELVLDGIGIKCRPVKSDGTLGAETNSGSMAGGSGGTAGSESCPGNMVLASQKGKGSMTGVGIGVLALGCHEWLPAPKKWGGRWLTSLKVISGESGLVVNTCSAATRPATGIGGKHGSIIDLFWLHCSDPDL